jgi:hypothetical protein
VRSGVLPQDKRLPLAGIKLKKPGVVCLVER